MSKFDKYLHNELGITVLTNYVTVVNNYPPKWSWLAVVIIIGNIQRWSPTLRGIIVLVFAQSVNRFGEFQF